MPAVCHNRCSVSTEIPLTVPYRSSSSVHSCVTKLLSPMYRNTEFFGISLCDAAFHGALGYWHLLMEVSCPLSALWKATTTHAVLVSRRGVSKNSQEIPRVGSRGQKPQHPWLHRHEFLQELELLPLTHLQSTTVLRWLAGWYWANRDFSTVHICKEKAIVLTHYLIWL